MARLTVVVSQAQGRNPEKRNLEEEIITRLMLSRGIDVLVVPHFYDLTEDSTALLALRQIQGHTVVLSWLFPRAAHWLLDQRNVRGRMGSVLLAPESDDEEDEALQEAAEKTEFRVSESRAVPERFLYHLDLRLEKSADPYVEEVLRIQEESSVSVVALGLGSVPIAKQTTPQTETTFVGLGTGGVITSKTQGLSSETLERFQEPTNDTALPLGPVTDLLSSDSAESTTDSVNGESRVERLTEARSKRRWYPVIDYSRCTNCMECIDFCLFGVYGVDTVDTILVDQPDNCRKGCPACSRVCPENAIMFPQHKTPAIAGSDDDAAGFKIDLSKLFGAPDEGKSAEEVAARERDEQLMLSGRKPLGMNGIRKRSTTPGERDELDQLIDQLDELDV